MKSSLVIESDNSNVLGNTKAKENKNIERNMSDINIFNNKNKANISKGDIFNNDDKSIYENNIRNATNSKVDIDKVISSNKVINNANKAKTFEGNPNNNRNNIKHISILEILRFIIIMILIFKLKYNHMMNEKKNIGKMYLCNNLQYNNNIMIKNQIIKIKGDILNTHSIHTKYINDTNNSIFKYILNKLWLKLIGFTKESNNNNEINLAQNTKHDNKLNKNKMSYYKIKEIKVYER